MFIHLHCHSPFSFLDGASSIEQLVAQAHLLGMPAMALTDHNTIAGLPSFHQWASTYGIQPISGVELTLDDGSHITILAENRFGYRNMCALVTLAHTGEGRRRSPRIMEQELFQHADGLIVLSGCRDSRLSRFLLRGDFDGAFSLAKKYQLVFGDSYYLEVQSDGYPQSKTLHRRISELSSTTGVPLVATGNVHYHRPELFPVHDILSCIRLQCNVYTPHARRPLNPERWLFGVEEANRRFAELPVSAMTNSMRIAERCDVVLDLEGALFPTYELPKDRSATEYLRNLVYEGARQRYGNLDRHLQNRLEHELSMIEQLGYVDYFLVVWDMVHFARQNRIRCTGRGSAADSAVAYCLYITDVDAAGRGLLFERFMSLERAERPDIDVDFDSRRRDEVITYMFNKYGSDHVCRVATYQTFRGRSAIRDIGAALGLPPPLLDGIAKRVPWMTHADRLERALEHLPELQTFSVYKEQLKWLWKLSSAVAGFPRHFGLHVGGLVISSRPLFETTSLQPSAKGDWMTPFDKDGVEAVGLVKLDLLSLRTMSAIEDTVVLRERQGQALDYDAVPLDDSETFQMLGTGNTIGVFQLESPAQRALQARLEPEGLEDIVASVALIRPGPIQGNMVGPFLARRRGNEPISYLHPKLEPILGKTFGVVLFQEQVIEIAMAVARFTPGEADQLRRVMSHARSGEEMDKIGRKFLEKAYQAGVEPEVAQTIFSYIQGYASYGFCEAHAAAFATTAYKTAYLVRHFPAEFYAAILNQYPMGYYPIHVICAEARRRGIAILGVDVGVSEWSCIVDTPNQIRLGFCLVKGFRKTVAEALTEQREIHGPFLSVLDCLRRVPSLDRLSMERLIRIGSFDSISSNRRELLFQLPDLLAARHQQEIPLLEGFTEEKNIPEDVQISDFPLASKLGDEYAIVGVGLSAHWMDLYRPFLAQFGYLRAVEVENVPDGESILIAGRVVRPHRPPTRSGKTVVFFMIEDETGMMDATMFEDVYHTTGAILFTPYGRLVGVAGTVQRRGGHRPQIIVSSVWALHNGR